MYPGVELLSPTVALSRHFVLPQDEAVEENYQAQPAAKRLALKIGKFSLVLPSGTLAEMVLSPKPYRLPNTPAWCLGLANIRGNLVPIFDLHLFLGEPIEAERPLLIVGDVAASAGILLDELPGYRTFSVEDKVVGRPVLPEFLTPHLGDVFRQEQIYFYELHHQAMLQQLAQLMAS